MLGFNSVKFVLIRKTSFNETWYGDSTCKVYKIETQVNKPAQSLFGHKFISLYRTVTYFSIIVVNISYFFLSHMYHSEEFVINARNKSSVYRRLQRHCFKNKDTERSRCCFLCDFAEKPGVPMWIRYVCALLILVPK